MIFDHDRTARACLRPIRGCATDEQYQDVVYQVRDALQNAFDLGFKAAGGSINSITPIEKTGERQS